MTNNLSVAISGIGHVGPHTNQQPLTLGLNYTIYSTNANGSGQVFSNWLSLTLGGYYRGRSGFRQPESHACFSE